MEYQGTIRTIGKFTAVAGLSSVLALAGLAGCSSSPAASSSSSSESASASSSSATSESAKIKAVETISIGKESNLIQPIQVENKLGTEVVAVQVVSGDTRVELPIEGGVWAAGEEANLYFDYTLGTSYDIALTCTNQIFTIHGIDFAALEQADGAVALSSQGDLAYLEYRQDGAAVSTLANEQERALAGTQAAAEAVESAPEAESVAEPVAESAPVYDEPVYSDSTTSSPAQTEDSCIDDVVLR